METEDIVYAIQELEKTIVSIAKEQMEQRAEFERIFTRTVDEFLQTIMRTINDIKLDQTREKELNILKSIETTLEFRDHIDLTSSLERIEADVSVIADRYRPAPEDFPE